MMSRQARYLGCLAAFAAAGAAHAATLEVSIVDTSGQPLPDAVAYAIPASGPVEARGRPTAVIEQVDREFVPYVSVIQAGTAVTFPNRDAILHHVYSFSPAKPFEIRLYTGKSPTEIVFDKAGTVTLGCNIHDWMTAYVLVVGTPHFGRADAKGVVRLQELPAGGYELRAWHPHQRAAVAPHAVTLHAAGTEKAGFVVDAAPRKARYKPPLDRLRY
jgi:plastocyanin